MENILVTGGAGYIGSHFVLKLLKEKKYNVIILDNLSTGHIETIESLIKYGDIKFFEGDITKPEDLERVFREQIDYVVHFASCALVEESVKDPKKYYTNNVFGTINLLNFMLNNNVKNIVFSSSAATYGSPKYIPIDENHPQKPINPYGTTKLMIENILKDYGFAYGLKSAILRYFNVIGANDEGIVGEWHDIETHLIPNILKSAIGQNREFSLFGTDYDTKDGTCVRDYVDVEDLACAHIKALEFLKTNPENNTNAFNLGTKEGFSVKEIFDTTQKVTNKKIPLKICERRAGDPSALVADNKKANEILNWKNTRTLEKSIQNAWLWEQKLNQKLNK